MKTSRLIDSICRIGMTVTVIALSPAHAGNPPPAKVLEAQRRMDAMAKGNAQHIARLRALEQRTQAAAAAKQPAAPKSSPVK